MSIPLFIVAGVKSWLMDNLLLFFTFTGYFTLRIFLRILERSPESILLIVFPGELFMHLIKVDDLTTEYCQPAAASLIAKMNGMISLCTIEFCIVTSLNNYDIRHITLNYKDGVICRN